MHTSIRRNSTSASWEYPARGLLDRLLSHFSSDRRTVPAHHAPALPVAPGDDASLRHLDWQACGFIEYLMGGVASLRDRGAGHVAHLAAGCHGSRSGPVRSVGRREAGGDKIERTVLLICWPHLRRSRTPRSASRAAVRASVRRASRGSFRAYADRESHPRSQRLWIHPRRHALHHKAASLRPHRTRRFQALRLAVHRDRRNGRAIPTRSRLH